MYILHMYIYIYMYYRLLELGDPQFTMGPPF